MKVAVTYDNGSIGQHFGRTEAFLVCNIENGEIVSSGILSAEGHGHHALPVFLFTQGVDTVICGGLGQHMVDGIRSFGMTLYYGASGDPMEAVASLLAGTLESNPLAIHTGCGGHHHA